MEKRGSQSAVETRRKRSWLAVLSAIALIGLLGGLAAPAAHAAAEALALDARGASIGGDQDPVHGPITEALTAGASITTAFVLADAEGPRPCMSCPDGAEGVCGGACATGALRAGLLRAEHRIVATRWPLDGDKAPRSAGARPDPPPPKA